MDHKTKLRILKTSELERHRDHGFKHFYSLYNGAQGQSGKLDDCKFTLWEMKNGIVQGDVTVGLSSESGPEEARMIIQSIP